MTRLGGVHPPPGTLQHRSEVLEALPRYFSGPTPISTRISQQAAAKMRHWRNNGRCLESDSSLIPFSDFPCPRRKTGNKTISQTAPYSGRRLCTRSEPRWGAWQPTLYTCLGVFQAFVVSAGLGSSRLSYLCWLSKLRTLMHGVAYAVVTYDDNCTVSFFMCVPAYTSTGLRRCGLKNMTAVSVRSAPRTNPCQRHRQNRSRLVAGLRRRVSMRKGR